MVYRDTNKRLYSEAEAADYLGITKRMLAKRRYDGKIDHVKDGHLISYEQRHLDAYLGRFSTAPPPQPEPEATGKWLAEFKARGSKKKNKQARPRPKYTKAERDARREQKKLFHDALMNSLLKPNGSAE